MKEALSQFPEPARDKLRSFLTMFRDPGGISVVVLRPREKLSAATSGPRAWQNVGIVWGGRRSRQAGSDAAG
jgi:hypothetical protein